MPTGPAARAPTPCSCGGLTGARAGVVLPALRRVLPGSVPLIGCDGLLPVTLLIEQAGRAARGTYISIKGLVNERLASALLDALARSDRTRASVSSELFRTRIRGDLLGSLGIDRNGDPAPVTIVRVEYGRGSNAVAGHEGARVERVITPPPELLQADG